MEIIQQQIVEMQKEIKRLREELDHVKNWSGQGQFDRITCRTWSILDSNNKTRIVAGTTPEGRASVVWLDKNEKVRIYAGTLSDGTVMLPIKDEA